ncbi:MAG: VWA domain-containing protein [Planctomycetes bacterium]|nr:VWA domain-containing protein [Planctomycetota bacterium]
MPAPVAAAMPVRLRVHCAALAWIIACAVLVAPLPAQTAPLPDDVKRYRKELALGSHVDKRLAAIENVAYYDLVGTSKLLVEHLIATLRRIEELEVERDENDKKLDTALKPQLEKAQKGLAPNYAGLEKMREAQQRIGKEIGVEEKVVRGYVAALSKAKNTDTLDYLMAKPPKQPNRLRLLLLEVLGNIDHAFVAEHLIGEIDDPVFEARMAAAAALLKQKPEFIPAGALAPLLRGSEWQERSVAIDALARIGDRTAVELLVNQTAKESGKNLADLCGRLEQITGQKFGKTAHAWVGWWQTARDGFAASGIDISQSAQVIKEDGKYAAFFKLRFDSLKIVYVIDLSGSMLAAIDDHENTAPEPGKSRADLLRREVKASISALPPDSSFNVIAYNDVVLPWSDKNQKASAENKKAVAEWLDGLVAAGQTNIFDALETAFKISPHSVKDKWYGTTGDTILFLSDGGPTCGRTTDCAEILREVKQWNETRRVTIHTVGIGAQVVELFLKDLAKQNGGQATFIKE